MRNCALFLSNQKLTLKRELNLKHVYGYNLLSLSLSVGVVYVYTYTCIHTWNLMSPADFTDKRHTCGTHTHTYKCIYMYVHESKLLVLVICKMTASSLHLNEMQN